MKRLEDCTAEAPFDAAQDKLRARSKEFLIKKFSELCVLCGREKKLKIEEILKIGINKIKDLQLPILAKIDFFSRPVPLW